ncbi:MAG: molybdopterin molybdotransferase MoeA [Flavobacteriales bacterium]
MISVEQAWQHIQGQPWKPQMEHIPLAESAGRILAEDVFATQDFPPFDRVMMDGIAVQLGHHKAGDHLLVKGTQFAGDAPLTLTDANGCLEIMTGAVLPHGTDTVIPVEHYVLNHGVVTLGRDAALGQHIHRQGTDRRAGDLLVDAGTRIHPGIIGVLATEGYAEVPVFTLPPCTIVSTGNELVDITEMPAPHQIRRSNVHVLADLARRAGLTPQLLHLHDDPAEMRKVLGPVLNAGGMVVLSGGVSKGKKDHVPEIMEALGVAKLFHRVAQRPGKPFWFGSAGKTVVFALPGNPVSATFGMMRYALPWLTHSLGQPTQPDYAVLTDTVSFRPSLTQFLPVQARPQQGRLLAIPSPTQGSGDLAGLVDVDGFVELDADQTEFPAGTLVPFYPFPA